MDDELVNKSRKKGKRSASVYQDPLLFDKAKAEDTTQKSSQETEELKTKGKPNRHVLTVKSKPKSRQIQIRTGLRSQRSNRENKSKVS